MFIELNILHFRVTMSVGKWIEVGHTQTRCGSAYRLPCDRPDRPEPPRDQMKKGCVEPIRTDRCFRLSIRCDQPASCESSVEEENDRCRKQKWLMFGYGTLSGFIVGCIVTTIVVMCIDSCSENGKESSEKNEKKLNGRQRRDDVPTQAW